jgi:Domain of unknown function (DUF4410)
VEENLGMRSLLITLLALLSSTGRAAAEDQRVAAPAHPDLIIVRQFATRGPIVALDPSLGFSLYRGAPGVPPARRAASVARATAFTLAETIAQQLRELGYDAVQSNETGPEPGGRALIVSGAFRSINEGHRRRFAAKDASVAAAAEIEYQIEGAQPQRLMQFGFAANPARSPPQRGGASRARGQFGGHRPGCHDRPCSCRAGTPNQLARGAALLFVRSD